MRTSMDEENDLVEDSDTLTETEESVLIFELDEVNNQKGLWIIMH